jgi:hypothetical protein
LFEQNIQPKGGIFFFFVLDTILNLFKGNKGYHSKKRKRERLIYYKKYKVICHDVTIFMESINPIFATTTKRITKSYFFHKKRQKMRQE